MAVNVLVPLDGTPVSESALPAARAAVRHANARVTLVSVVDLPFEFISWLGVSRAYDVDEVAAAVREREQYLHGFEDTFDGVQVDTIVRTGKAPERILEVAGEVDAGLIAMARHGRSGVRRVIAGSVAARVLHNAECPVLLVKGSSDPEAAQGIVPLENILVPLDGSVFSETALQTIRDLFGTSGYRIRLHRVVELATYTGGTIGGGFSHQLLEDYANTTQGEAVSYLERTSRMLREQGYHVAWQVTQGGIFEEIQRVASDLDVNLIAMATHGRSGLPRFLLGSVAERVLRDAEMPVLLVRPSGMEEAPEMQFA